MPIPLTPEMLHHAYEYLRCQKPFSGWRLPPASTVKFSVKKHRDRFAHHQLINGVHHIVFSSRFVGRHSMVLATMAHEMIHVYHEVSCENPTNPHGKTFQRFADRICKIHEDFDRLTF